MAERIDREELRQLVREVLKEALGERDPSPPLRRGRRASGRRWSEAITSREPALGPSTASAALSPQAAEAARRAPPATVRGEFDVRRAHRSQGGRDRRARIPRSSSADVVAVTPLARDRARELKLEIVRQKP